jgi:hypothetical protein
MEGGDAVDDNIITLSSYLAIFTLDQRLASQACRAGQQVLLTVASGRSELFASPALPHSFVKSKATPATPMIGSPCTFSAAAQPIMPS